LWWIRMPKSSPVRVKASQYVAAPDSTIFLLI
jgi:hypothetical protein